MLERHKARTFLPTTQYQISERGSKNHSTKMMSGFLSNADFPPPSVSSLCCLLFSSSRRCPAGFIKAFKAAVGRRFSVKREEMRRWLPGRVESGLPLTFDSCVHWIDWRVLFWQEGDVKFEGWEAEISVKCPVFSVTERWPGEMAFLPSCGKRKYSRGSRPLRTVVQELLDVLYFFRKNAHQRLLDGFLWTVIDRKLCPLGLSAHLIQS